MWFGKDKMKKLFLALAMAVPAFAADAHPLYFDYIIQSNLDAQNDEWDYLMKFKLWGTEGITSGRINLPDSIGWIGTARGGFAAENNGIVLGGPKIFGGNVDLQNGNDSPGNGKDAQFLKGYLRTNGSLYSALSTVFDSTVCIEKSYFPPSSMNPSEAPVFNGERIEGSAATSGKCAPDKVPLVKTSLAVPKINPEKPYSLSIYKNNFVGKSYNINIPAATPEDELINSGVYDLYIDKIEMDDEDTLYFNMPEGGRLTRVFIGTSFTHGTKLSIQVKYNGKIISNDKYEGNLLFYIPHDFEFSKIDYAPIQGTFISTGTISIVSNMAFAGQMIANKIELGNEIDAKSFIYKPFDPPKIDPTALAKGVFKEDKDKNWEIPISLDENAKNDVTFKYCFLVKDESLTSEGVASIQDFGTNAESSKYPEFPICKDDNSVYGEVRISSGNKTPDDPVLLNAKYDTKDEPTETLYFKVFDLGAAVFPKGNTSGVFELYIQNTPIFSFKDVEDNYYIDENSEVGNDTVAQIEVVGVSTSDLIASMTDDDTDANSVKLNDLFNITFDATKSSVVITVKKHDELNYESSRIKQVYNVTLKLTDNCGSTTCQEKTAKTKINVTDVNEAPTINQVEDLNPDAPTVLPLTVHPYENSKDGDAIGVVKATDVDTKSNGKYNHLEYEILDKTVPFRMRADVNGGNTDSTIVVSGNNKLDFETKNVYTFDVRVTSCEWDPVNKVVIPPAPGDKCPEDIKTITVRLQNVNEPPIIIDDNPDTLKIAERSNPNTEVARFEVQDPDEDDAANLLTQIIPSIKDNNTKTGVVHAEDLFTIAMEKDNGKYYAVVRVINDVDKAKKLDFEEIMKTLKDSVFVVTLTFKDQGGVGSDVKDTSIVKKIAVTDVNEAPSVTGVEDLNGDYKDPKDDFTFYPKEDLVAGGSVGYVHTDDPDVVHLDEFGYREFSLDNPSNYPFEMKDSLLVLTKKLDYEKDPRVYTFKVVVNNCERVKNSSGKYEKKNPPKCADPVTQTVTVKIQDVDEPPKIIPECEGDKCPDICADGSCDVCVGEGCVNRCVENCDNPRGDDPAKTLTVAVKENSQTGHKIISYAVRDEDYGVGHTTALTAEIWNTNGSGADTLFEAKMVKDINGNWNVVVSVIDRAKLDYEKINETHNVTIYVSDPEDSDGMYDSLLRVIKVVDENEAPSIVCKTTGKCSVDLPENTPAGDTISTLAVTDPDKNPLFRRLKYEVVEDPMNPVPFRMDSNNVVVTKTLNYEKDPKVYTFKVAVTDITDETLTDTALVTINLKNVNEKPTIIIDGPIPDGNDDSDPFCVAYCDTTGRGVGKDSILTIGVRENTEDGRIYSETGKVLVVYHYADEDAGDLANVTVSWFDSATTIPSVTTMGTDLFNLVYSNGSITVSVKDEILLDYEILRNAKSRDDPDPEYTIGIVVKDAKGLADTLYRKIRVTDENEKPSFTAEPCVVVEGNHPGDSIGHVEQPSDIDALSRNPALYDNYFKMTGGDLDRFELRKDSTDLMRVMLAAVDSIDCENGSYVCGVDSVYWVVLTYGDTTLKTVYNNIKIPVKILDRNEEPIIKTDTIGVYENSPKGTDVGIIDWLDHDTFDSVLHFEITKDPSGCFVIDEKTGAVTVKSDNCTALDHEKYETLEIEVAVTDLVTVTETSNIYGGPNTVKKTITVNVHDVNEPPAIVKETFYVDEDAKKGSVVDTVKAKDPDTNPEYSKLIYTVIGGDTATFKIDSITGIVTLKDTLDYETKKEYELVVRVFDGEFADTAIVPIKVRNKEEKSEVKITLFDDSTRVWHNPDTVYTNSPGREICWVQGRTDRDLKDTCMDVHINKDTVIVIRYKDPTTDTYGVDSLVIFYSNAAPIVTISGSTDDIVAENVFTIVEKTEQADTNLYVNERNKDVRVTVKDPASKTDTSFVVSLKLDAVNVPQKTLDVVNRISKENRFVLSGPKEGETRTPVNGNEVKISYREVLGKDTVMVSYMTDVSGDPVKVPVVDEKGNVDSVEVMTVSYNTIIDGKKVTVSFQVDAMTGEVLVKNSNGTLMVSGASKSASGSSNGNTGSSSSSSKTDDVTEGMFQITYSTKDVLGNSTTITYSVDEKGRMVKNAEGDTGYSVAYSYTNKYGNSATQSLFIVLDQVGPKVEILSPVKGQVIRSNFVSVTWTVNGVEQDTLTMQGLEKGPNVIVRFFRDKAGNEASDTVLVIMKDSKDVDIAVVTPVTEMDPETVREYYEEHPLEKGETFAVSIMNPSTGKEIETLKGGSFKTKKGSEEELYPGKDKKHLGPTLALDVKLPVVNAVGGLATMDDLVSSDGMVSLEGVDAKNSTKITVEKYAQEYCEEGFNVNGDLSQVNLYRSKMVVKIWVYTSLGSFVDYFSFTQDLNNPEYTNEAGMLKMFFEMKPDKDGFVKADNGKLYATGAYLYKVDAKILSSLRCTLPPVKDPSGKKKGDRMKSSDELLKPFGYQRPKTK